MYYISKEEELKDIPEADLKNIIEDYKDSGASDVKKIKQPDGKYTVIATFD